jgi:deoxyribonuclease V
MSLELVEKQTALTETAFPYIPTLLSFREMKPAVTSIRKLKTCPDLFLVDAHGFAHPYHCGFASHFGLVLNIPTIGAAKRKLVGQIKDSASHADSKLIEYKRQIVGAEVYTKTGCQPVYVSVGNMITLKTAIKIVKHCARNSRIPKPIQIAH